MMRVLTTIACLILSLVSMAASIDKERSDIYEKIGFGLISILCIIAFKLGGV